MTPIQWTSDAMALIGLGLLGLSIYELLRRKVDDRAANEMIVKLASSRSLPRTLKLAQAAPGSYLDAIAAAIAAGLAGSRDEAALAERVHAAFEAAGTPLLARSRRVVTRGLVGAMLVGGAVAVAASDHLPRPLLGAAAAAGLGVLALFGQGAHVGRALASARHDVLPVLLGVLGDEPAS